MLLRSVDQLKPALSRAYSKVELVGPLERLWRALIHESVEPLMLHHLIKKVNGWYKINTFRYGTFITCFDNRLKICSIAFAV